MTAPKAASVQAAYYGGGTRYLIDVLTGALDAFDEVTGRTREDLAEEQWRDLASVVA